jgi:hypothetical protein
MWTRTGGVAAGFAGYAVTTAAEGVPAGRFFGGVTLLHSVSWQDPSNCICQDASPSKCPALYTRPDELNDDKGRWDQERMCGWVLSRPL